MNGKIVETGFRQENGCYQQRFYPGKPTPEEVTEAQSRLICACCNVDYWIPTTQSHVKKYGTCPGCQLVLDGKMAYIDLDGKRKIAKSCCITRPPTIEEIKKTWKGGALTSIESSIVMKVIREKT